MDLSHQKASLLGQLKRHLKKTGDSEPEQALIRLVIGSSLVIFYCIPWGSETGQYLEQFFGPLANQIIIVATLIAFSIFAAIIINPKPSPSRRIVGIFLDQSSLSILLYWTGGEHLPLFVFYLWVILGNGFRYGLKYLYISFAVSLVGFGSVVLWSEYWQTHQSFATSLFIILSALPLYAAVLIKKLHAAIDMAKQANEAKSRFLANMSHELRTPLNGVIGIGDLLKETNLTKEQRNLADMMQSSANTLLQLIESVLDIAKIEAGKINIEYEPLDLHSLVNSVIYMLAPLGSQKELIVSCSVDSNTPFKLNGDQQHLRQILVNLVSNAIKFTDAGTVHLRVYCSGGTREKPRIRFDITDTGIGIDPESIANIFEDFTRAKISSTRKLEGAGLGTAISKELVELMNGSIGVQSEPGKGSTFWFEVPLETSAQTEYEQLSNHILLIATEDTAETFQPLLEGWNLEFTCVHSSARAVSLLLQAAEQDKHYHTAIIDQAVLHELNPVQFAKMLRKEKQLDNLALILLDQADSESNIDTINSYFITTLKAIEKRSLYNSIHAARSPHFSDENVVTLADHFGKNVGDKCLNILAAEDNPVNQHVLRGILKSVGHEVTMVNTGEQVLDAIAENVDAYDLVILDKNMPEKSGIEVVKLLRFMDASHSLPIIMLTADATPEAKIESIDAGSDAFLTKPVNAKALLEQVAALTKQGLTATHRTSAPNAVSLFQEDDKSDTIVNLHTLEELAKLGEDSNFIHNLVVDYLRDSKKHVQNIKKASASDFLAFRESLHALKGSSTELGARQLAEYCLTGEAFKPYQLGSPEVIKYVSKIDEVYRRTESILAKIADVSNFHNVESDHGSLQ
jgi:two-component system sensor histidine kinase RpfC